MLVQTEKLQISEFMEEFSRRFKNFCQKAPVLLSFKVSPMSVSVHELASNEVKIFPFNFSTDVKGNIKTIKDWLCDKKYPIMTEIVVSHTDYTTDELQELLDSGKITIDDVANKKREETVIRRRIERVVIKRDEFFIRDLETGRVFQYKMNMPSSLFLKKTREKLSSFDAWTLFKSKAYFIKEIDENYKEISE